MLWNYRVGTTESKNIWYGSPGPEGDEPTIRTYCIIKCFYLESLEEEPFNFAKASITSDGTDLNILKWEITEMLKIFDLPILDIDNFPKIFK
jgi:hypothetical protein